MKKILSSMILFMGVFCAPALAQPATTLVIIGVEELDYAPHYTTQSGSFRGFGRDLLDAFAASEGIRLEYRAMPVPRLYQALIEGRIGFKYPDNPSWQAEFKQAAGIVYSRPVVSYLDGIMVRPARLARAAEPLRALALVRGFSLPAETPWKATPPLLQEQSSLGAAIRDTMLGHSEGLFGNIMVLQHQMRQVMMLPADSLVFDPRLPHQRGSYHLSARGQQALLTKFDIWLLRETSLIEALKQRYGLTD